MTKLREPQSFKSAMTRILGLLGTERAAEMVEKSDTLLRYWSDPDDEATLMLTARQRGVLDFITDYAARWRRMPTLQRIADKCGFSHRARAWHVVTQLIDRGFLVRHARKLYLARPIVCGVAIPVERCESCGDVIPRDNTYPGCGQQMREAA